MLDEDAVESHFDWLGPLSKRQTQTNPLTPPFTEYTGDQVRFLYASRFMMESSRRFPSANCLQEQKLTL